MSASDAAAVRAIAHRGASRLARENTLPALRRAVEAGADAVEIDVRITADGRCVVVHDPTLERLWGQRVVVGETTYADLRRVCPPSPAGIPDLEEAARSVTPHATLVIDVGDTTTAVAALAELAAAGIGENFAFTGDTDALIAVRAREPGVELFLSWDSPHLPDPAILQRARAEYLNLDARLVTREIVETVRSWGMGVSCYTVNDPDRMRALIDIGVGAIISDDIAALVSTRRRTDVRPSGNSQ